MEKLFEDLEPTSNQHQLVTPTSFLTAVIDATACPAGRARQRWKDDNLVQTAFRGSSHYTANSWQVNTSAHTDNCHPTMWPCQKPHKIPVWSGGLKKMQSTQPKLAAELFLTAIISAATWSRYSIKTCNLKCGIWGARQICGRRGQPTTRVQTPS
jgi:hypothetical protein